jgi:hypothetical protein
MGIPRSRMAIYRGRRGVGEYTSSDSVGENYWEKTVNLLTYSSGLPTVWEAWLAPLAKGGQCSPWDGLTEAHLVESQFQ